MAGNKKNPNSKKKVVYPRKQYTQDIQSGVKNYVDAIRMVSMTKNVITLVTTALEEKRVSGVEIKEEHEEALEVLSVALNTTIDNLEEVEKEFINSPPVHFVGNSLKVDEWNLDLHSRIIDATQWMASVNDVYRELVDTYELDLGQEPNPLRTEELQGAVND